MRKKTETVMITWRAKEALRRRLEAAAKHNEVSVNAEITRRIEESFTRAEQASLTENVDRLFAGLFQRVRASSEAIEGYRKNAEECRQLAEQSNDLRAKTGMLSLADAWLRLAAAQGRATEKAFREVSVQSKEAGEKP
jgi:hypothetical protein